jgi:hypothetical protein
MAAISLSIHGELNVLVSFQVVQEHVMLPSIRGSDHKKFLSAYYNEQRGLGVASSSAFLLLKSHTWILVITAEGDNPVTTLLVCSYSWLLQVKQLQVRMW